MAPEVAMITLHWRARATIALLATFLPIHTVGDAVADGTEGHGSAVISIDGIGSTPIPILATITHAHNGSIETKLLTLSRIERIEWVFRDV
jgi:hypothetical protein